MRFSSPLLCLALFATAPLAVPAAEEPRRITDTGNPLAAVPGEPVVISRLRGLRFVAAPAQLTAPGFPAEDVHTELVPEVDPAGMIVAMSPFLGEPASQASLERMLATVRACLQAGGRPFANVYLPPQDITDGYVQVVVAASRSSGPVTVLGAVRFSKESYRRQVRQAAGAPIDADQLADDVAWLNRNPYRQVTAGAQAGLEPGTTNLILEARERRPLSVNAGYSNSGTRTTDVDRLSTSVTWGNAFGRGDLMTYGFSGDPRAEHIRSHSLSYTAFLPWRHVLTTQAAYSTVESAVPEPFAQRGKSWQVGTRYEVPLAAPRAGWAQNLNVTADFKYSDNTLEFAAIPVTGNATHIVQLGGNYGVNFPALRGQNGAAVTVFASPGGITGRNRDVDFNGSRAGARARYAGAKFNLSHQRSLPAGFTYSAAAEFQVASGALLGTEQMNGGGSAAVRGYRDSSAFGDTGVLVNQEVHAPAASLWANRVRADVFGFADFASLNLRVDRESVDLRSVGLGCNLVLGRRLSIRAAYGWQLKQLDRSPDERGHGHISSNLSW